MLSLTTRNNILDKFSEIRDVRLEEDCTLYHGVSQPAWTIQGSSAFTHFYYDFAQQKVRVDHPDSRIVCFSDEKWVYAASGDLSELFWHEYAHVISDIQFMEDLNHGPKFSEAVAKLGRPWLDGPYVKLDWYFNPPTLETWKG